MKDEEKKAIERMKKFGDSISCSDYPPEAYLEMKEDIEDILYLIEKQQKEIEELKKPKYVIDFKTNEIIKKVKYICDNWYDEYLEIDVKWIEGLLDLYNKEKEKNNSISIQYEKVVDKLEELERQIKEKE